MLVSVLTAVTSATKAIRDDPWWRVYWWQFGGGEITHGGEFTGGKSSSWRGDHKPQPVGHNSTYAEKQLTSALLLVIKK